VARKYQKGAVSRLSCANQFMMLETELSNRFEPFDVCTDWLGKTTLCWVSLPARLLFQPSRGILAFVLARWRVSRRR
jgi:hypothetical protein